MTNTTSTGIATSIGTIAGIIIMLCLVALIVAATWWLIRKMLGLGAVNRSKVESAPTWEVKEETKRG
jgi:glycerol-3-phosphate acyltransferase PlsY